MPTTSPRLGSFSNQELVELASFNTFLNQGQRGLKGATFLSPESGLQQLAGQTGNLNIPFDLGRPGEALAGRDFARENFPLNVNKSGTGLTFPVVGELIRRSLDPGGDVIPGVNAPSELQFSIIGGEVKSFNISAEPDRGPKTQIDVAGEEGSGQSPRQFVDQQRQILRGEGREGAAGQFAFRSRTGRGRGSTILSGALGDATILGGAGN